MALCRHFRVPAAVCVNKFDLNLGLEAKIHQFCAESQLAVTQSIPFDESVTKAIQQGLPLVEFNHGMASCAVSAVWGQIGNLLNGA